MDKGLILHSIKEHNIMPLTSYCNANCVFCSHQGNPPDLKIITIGMRNYGEVFEEVSFLNADRPIVIGESATRIIEGEPFLFKRLPDLLTEIRKLYPKTELKLTTNGTLLNEAMVSHLAQLGNIEINLSLNAVSSDKHLLLMGNQVSEESLNNGFWFKKYQLPFHGSMVAMPWLTGWDEISSTIKYLEENGALSVRVFLPGYSKYSPPELQFKNDLLHELKEHLAIISRTTSMPILLEPPLLKDLTPQIAGVIEASLADICGFKPGDVILTVNGREPYSRVDAWHQITKAKNPQVKIQRKNEIISLSILKQKHQKSGIVCEYDVDLERAQKLRKFDNKLSLVITSEFAFPLISQLPKILGLSQTTVIAAKNITFGGSIACAGLMTLKDIEAALPKDKHIDTLILPSEMFDYFGNDLFGINYHDLEERHKFKVIII